MNDHEVSVEDHKFSIELLKIIAEFAETSYGVVNWISGQEHKKAREQLDRFFERRGIDSGKLISCKDNNEAIKDFMSELRSSLLG